MKRHPPLAPARLAFDADGTPFNTEHGDVYHPRGGALPQAEHVFVRGNGLPRRWRGKRRFVVLETGFGLGNNFLATWAAWRADAQRSERLDFVSVEHAPVDRGALARVHAASPLRELADELTAAWPVATPDLHLLSFDGGRVRLLLALGEVDRWLPALDLQADAIYLDGFAPAKNPAMWQPRVFKAIARLAAPGATAATWSAARAVRDGLRSAGFEVQAAPGQGGKRDITLARFAPHAPPAGRRLALETPQREAVVVGAGLAGCATAASLVEAGWQVLLLDRHPAPSTEASGNPAGLFHAIVHGDDGPHSRWARAAARLAQRRVRAAMAADGIAGGADGVLRLAPGDTRESLEALRLRLGLPAASSEALDADAAGAAAGVPLTDAAWWHHEGGWADPVALATAWRRRAGDGLVFSGSVAVERLVHEGHGWALFDAAGTRVAAAPLVVLCNAADAGRLVPHATLPLQRSRGQLSWIRCDAAGPRPLPRLPVAGAGYLLPPLNGRVLFGATQTEGDEDASLRAADHAVNAERLARLSPAWAGLDATRLGGRVAWRATAPDRLPLCGPVEALQIAPGTRCDQPRFVPRAQGLMVLTGLGSRGIGSAALAAELVTAWVEGAPMPVEAGLRDALDPVRFHVRRWRAGCA
jgi:tRNA 5-methylaminomethyl-2-thiouridine biosynthesis bifunctional protein